MWTDEMSYSIYDHVIKEWKPGYVIRDLSRVSGYVGRTYRVAYDVLEDTMGGVLHDM